MWWPRLPSYWPEWIVAWFIRIPGVNHRSKTAMLVILKDQETLLVKLLVYQVKKLCI